MSYHFSHTLYPYYNTDRVTTQADGLQSLSAADGI
jgi:hypothetical protein